MFSVCLQSGPNRGGDAGGAGGAMAPPGFFQYIGVPFSPNTVFLNAYFHVSIMFSNIECLHNNDFISY